MAQHTAIFEEAPAVTITVGVKGNALLLKWGSGAGFRAYAINPSSIHHVEVSGLTVALDWGPPDRGTRLAFVCTTVAIARAMAEDLVFEAAKAKRQEDPANGTIV